MKELVLVIGTLDTKGPEVAYLRDKLKEYGLNPYVKIGRAHVLNSSHSQQSRMPSSA